MPTPQLISRFLVLAPREGSSRCIFTRRAALDARAPHVELSLSSPEGFAVYPVEPSNVSHPMPPMCYATLGLTDSANSATRVFYRHSSLCLSIGSGGDFYVACFTTGTSGGEPLIMFRGSALLYRTGFFIWERVSAQAFVRVFAKMFLPPSDGVTFITYFHLNDDGSISPHNMPHLVLGIGEPLAGEWVPAETDLEAIKVEQGIGKWGQMCRLWSVGSTAVIRHPSGIWEKYTMTREGDLVESDGSIKYKAVRPESPSSENEGEMQWTNRIKELIHNDCIALVRGAYFEDCFQRSEPISKRQDIPQEYFWQSGDALEQWERHHSFFLIIVSYSWLSKRHPDPELYHLQRFVPIVRQLQQRLRWRGGDDVAIAWDFTTLFQAERDAVQQDMFKKGLLGFNLLYGHKDVIGVKLKSTPKSEARLYDDRGWTLSESILIDSKAESWNKLVVDDSFDPSVEMFEQGYHFMKRFCQHALSPPLVPEAFEAKLDERRSRAKDRGVDLFTGGTQDEQIVVEKYRDCFQLFANAWCLNYVHAGWGCAQIQVFAPALRVCSVRVLSLEFNNLRSKGVAVLCEALHNSKTLQQLLLMRNNIGVKGGVHIVALIRNVPSLRQLCLELNPLCKSRKTVEELRVTWAHAGKTSNLLELAYQPGVGR